MKIGCIIQARVSSSRLPKKILLPLPIDSDITVLEHVIRRVKKSTLINHVALATTTNAADDPIIEIAKSEEIDFYRGSEQNVLSRYFYVSKKRDFDIIVRITSDCPCIDWNIIDTVILKHIDQKNDYTSNTLERTFPHGLDVEVFNYDILSKAYKNATKKFELEHVTSYFYKSHPDKFKIGKVKANKNINKSDIRITLDTKEDYTLISAIYSFLYEKNNFFKTTDIINLFREYRWLYDINRNVEQKKTCKNLEEEIQEALRLLDIQDLERAKKYLKEKYYGK
ncbi:MAG: cytidylyltransferase domain-containing protein [Fusobacteriota bacterium]